MKLGLLGKPLQHSFSPTFFAEKFRKLGLENYHYNAYELPQLNGEILHELIGSENLSGFNVTIPFKETILPLLNNLSPDAASIGAVNTVDVEWSKNELFKLKGYNTDWSGFLKAIRPFLTVHHQKALILGTGGASKAIAFALKSLGIEYFFVGRNEKDNRHNQLNYEQLNKFAIENFKLIVNTSPLGTFPNVDQAPAIPYQFLGKEHLLCDLVYNPAETAFMMKGKEYGATVLNGLSMLQFQAEEAWNIWYNKKGHSV